MKLNNTLLKNGVLIMDSFDNPYEERDFSKLSYADLKKLKAKRKENLANNQDKLREVQLSKWMRKNDKEHFLDFEEEVDCYK